MLETKDGKLAVDADDGLRFPASGPGVTASRGVDLTVQAVQDGKIAAKTSTGACAPAHNSADIELNGAKPWRSPQQLRRHQVAQSVLAGLRAADRQGVQRRTRVQGWMGGWSEDARRRPAHRQRLVALRRADVNGQRHGGLHQHRVDHRPAARDQLREIKQVKRNWPDRAVSFR